MSQNPAHPELVMQISLNVLEHLGINLYSNIPAVISEIVANAWDADAEKVDITIKESTITIVDDGIGMSRQEVVNRYLVVGFQRREKMDEMTAKGRAPMGRKGIGKLSIFSIAKQADIFTTNGEEKTAFRLDREAIRKMVSEDGSQDYHPEELPLTEWPEGLIKGTHIQLSGLDKKITTNSLQGLSSRIARRFSVIEKQDFTVSINGKVITAADRGYQKFVQYLWHYGLEEEELQQFKEHDIVVNRAKEVKKALKNKGYEITISGWIGTVKNPSQLKENKDNLNNIAVFMRGKLAQEDILSTFGMKEIVADYIVGEIYCDELDIDEQQDIATSSRQNLREDDKRYDALRDIIHHELKHIANQWSNLRREDGIKKFVQIPAVSKYIESLQGDTKQKAKRWIGRLNTLRSDNVNYQKSLLRGAILAFETQRHREKLDALEKIEDESIEQVIKILMDIGSLEQTYYGQVAKTRVEIIKKLEEKVANDDIEKVLQKYIFDHLWLLDPSWERAKGDSFMERSVKQYLDGKYCEGLSEEEKNGRIDIGYRTTMGKHVIVEMKRASVKIGIYELTEQIGKYQEGVSSIIEKAENKGQPHIEIICLLGSHPGEWKKNPQKVLDMLKAHNARVLIYDELLNNARKAYADYLEQHKKIDYLWGIFQAIDDFEIEEA